MAPVVSETGRMDCGRAVVLMRGRAGVVVGVHDGCGVLVRVPRVRGGWIALGRNSAIRYRSRGVGDGRMY